MKVHHTLERSGERPLVLAIGYFDGLHRGHREILRTLLRLRRPGFHAGVLTFTNHPKTYLRPGEAPKLITTLDERVNLLAQAGLDEAFVVPFDERIATLDATAFLESVILDSLRAQSIVFGENFRFGNGRRGDPALARDVLGAHGVPITVVPPLLDDSERISSTRIRAAIAGGDTARADALLGAPFTLRGRVVLGAGRGHDLGFPTANLDIPQGKIVPADGVYSVLARYDGGDRVGLVSIGTNPTFDGQERTVEVWLRDFDESIYGEVLALREFRFIRAQRRFESAAELVAQIREDATHVRFPAFSKT